VLRNQVLHGIERNGADAPGTSSQVPLTWSDARPKIGTKKANFALDKRAKTLTCNQWSKARSDARCAAVMPVRSVMSMRS